MKIWRLALLCLLLSPSILAAATMISFKPSNLSGTWERVWDEDVTDAGNEL